MTAIIKFDESTIFEGFTVSYKISDDMSKTIIIADCFRKLEGVLDSLSLNKIKVILKRQSFIIESSIDDLKDGDTIYVSAMAT